jgi:hypothetical protein
MIVWMTCSSTPLLKETSTFAVLIVQQLPEESGNGDIDVAVDLLSGRSVTGTIVNFSCGIRKAPPSILI